MQKSSALSNEAVVGLLANNLGVTARAVKTMKSENPERFEREAMGTILTVSGSTLEDVVALFNANENLLNIGELARKAKLLDSILAESAKYLKEGIGIGYWSREKGMFLANTLNSMFSSYRSPENEGLKIELIYKPIPEDAPIRTREDMDKYVPDHLTVMKVSILNDGDAFDAMDTAFKIKVFRKDDTLKSLGDLFKEIKQAYPEMMADKIKHYTYNVSIEAAFETESHGNEDHIFFGDMEKNAPFKVKTIDAILNNIKIRQHDYSQGSGDTETQIRIGEYMYEKDSQKTETENSAELVDFLNKVVSEFSLKDSRIDKILEKIEDYNNKQDSYDGDQETVVIGYARNYLSIVLDLLYPGSYAALSGVFFQYGHPMDRYDLYDVIKGKWECIDEAAMLYRTVSKYKGEAFPPHYSGGTPE